MRSHSFLAFLAIVSLAATPVAAQSIEGMVVDATSGEPVVGATIAALAGSATVGTVYTGSTGLFQLNLPRDGSYRLRTSRVGFGTLTSDVLPVAAAGQTRVLIKLDALPVALGPLSATASRREPGLEREGFYQRQQQGFGTFLDRRAIEVAAARGVMRMTELLEGLAGVRVAGSAGDVLMPGADATAAEDVCWPSVVLDGMVLRAGGPHAPNEPWSSLDGLIRPVELEAVEVYSHAIGAPVEAGGRVSPCGAIVAWSRMR